MNKNILMYLQWGVIILLILHILFVRNRYNKKVSFLLSEVNKNETVISYQTSKFSDLKNDYNTLYENYKNDKNIEYIVQYKYKYKYDTIFVNPDKKEDVEVDGDTLTNYTYIKDTTHFSYNINVLSKVEPKRVSIKFMLDDEFTIVGKKVGDDVQTSIKHSGDGEITPVVAWRKKDKFIDRFYLSFNSGVGYGILNKKPDIFVGAGISYKFH